MNLPVLKSTRYENEKRKNPKNSFIVTSDQDNNSKAHFKYDLLLD
jgi:hypothetical protein